MPFSFPPLVERSKRPAPRRQGWPLRNRSGTAQTGRQRRQRNQKGQHSATHSVASGPEGNHPAAAPVQCLGQRAIAEWLHTPVHGRPGEPRRMCQPAAGKGSESGPGYGGKILIRASLLSTAAI